MRLFVTGTDTGVGKTRATLTLMAALKKQGRSVCGMKPVACGSEKYDGYLRNDDALKIQDLSTKDLDYDLVNPYALSAHVAPIFAANDDNNPISINVLKEAYERLRQGVDTIVVEGLGGWRMPLSKHEQMSDLVKILQLRVILVIGLRMGCINHALLTREAILRDGLDLTGWIANCLDPAYDRKEQTCNFLAQNLGAPLLGVLPYQQELDLSDTVSRLNLKHL